MFPDKIDCENFDLVKPNSEFALALSLLVSENQQEFKYIYFTKTLIDVSKAEIYLKNALEKWDKGEQYSYFLFHGSQLMGCVGIKIRPGGLVGEMSYFLDKKYTGYGYISKALTALTKVFWKNGGHRVEIFCNETNLPSVAVAKRLGYHLDGVMREYECIDEHFDGVAIFSKIKGE